MRGQHYDKYPAVKAGGGRTFVCVASPQRWTIK
jgi:hypothetical protein